MRNMGIAPFNIASSVILITAQRLARRLCPQCKAPMDIPREALIEAGFDENELDVALVVITELFLDVHGFVVDDDGNDDAQAQGRHGQGMALEL